MITTEKLQKFQGKFKNEKKFLTKKKTEAKNGGK